jgi:hypothetical protein
MTGVKKAAPRYMNKSTVQASVMLNKVSTILGSSKCIKIGAGYSTGLLGSGKRPPPFFDKKAIVESLSEGSRTYDILMSPSDSWTIGRIAAICAGVDPQQAPTI